LKERKICILTTTSVFILFYFSVTIVLYCASGRRAAKAQAILLEKEYKKVLNAGGLNDLLGFLKA
jgi:rhodanese-related sulfurtransferase